MGYRSGLTVDVGRGVLDELVTQAEAVPPVEEDVVVLLWGGRREEAGCVFRVGWQGEGGVGR